MILNLISIAAVLGLAYLWANRGMFSALLHTACVIVAGAIAFALWEPIATILVDAAPARGFFSYLGEAAWGITLIAAFGVSLFVLRIAADATVRNNVKLPFLANLLGGLLVALPGSIITTGIIVIGLSHINFGVKLFGFQPVTYTEKGGLYSGQLEKTASLWIPADALTSSFYGFVSEGAFSTRQPLAKWYPDLEVAGHTNRMTFQGKGRTSMLSDGVRLESRYTLGDAQQGAAAGTILGDRQLTMTLDGDPIAAGRIEGFVLLFEPKAAEETSQFIFSNGTVRLISENPLTGERLTLHPVAIISERRGQSGHERFPYEAKDQFVSTVGADQSKAMGFEFFVPTGHNPIGLFVRGTRIELDQDASDDQTVFTSPAQRDASIPSLMGGARLAGLDTSTAQEIAINSGQYEFVSSRPVLGVTITSTRAKPALALDDDNRVTSGEIRLDVADTKQRNVASQLRVNQFSVPDGVQIIQVTMSGLPDTNPLSLMSDTFRTSPPDETTLHLVDSELRTYQPVGFIVNDGTWWDMRYTPANPISTIGDLPDADPTNPEGRTITLLFQVSVGSQIQAVALNDKALVTFDPPIEIRRGR